MAVFTQSGALVPGFSLGVFKCPPFPGGVANHVHLVFPVPHEQSGTAWPPWVGGEEASALKPNKQGDGAAGCGRRMLGRE